MTEDNCSIACGWSPDGANSEARVNDCVDN
jgi:hypothetical protein